MALDLLIVDDDPDTLSYLSVMADEIGLDYKCFSSGLETLGYLEENIGDLPRGYLVDIRLDKSEAELQSSSKIFNFLKGHNATEKFRFYTAHYLENNLYVEGITSAEITKMMVVKPGMEEVSGFFKELKETK